MIHSKLSSPERLKKLSPEEELNKINNRLSIAEVNRDRNVAGIKQKVNHIVLHILCNFLITLCAGDASVLQSTRTGR